MVSNLSTGYMPSDLSNTGRAALCLALRVGIGSGSRPARPRYPLRLGGRSTDPQGATYSIPLV